MAVAHVPHDKHSPHHKPEMLGDDQETDLIIGPGHDYESVTKKIADAVLVRPVSWSWLAMVGGFGALLGMLLMSLGWTFLMGVGIWGINIPVAWAFDIINFVWWIGIGHAGTLISAILLLLHQGWRTSINRFAEAMTLFAVVCAGMYVTSHVGRHQYAYWLFPIPNTMGLWPQFRSPLSWDVFAVSTYATVSALFWYVGLVPDLATLRDRAENPVIKRLYAIAALGWRGSQRHWHRYTALYLILAGISTPLVLSVHSTISFDFAFGLVPGWHSTIFPPYFVAGAVFAGFAFVLILAIPLRAFYNMRDLITMRHIENCAKVMLATGNVVFYGYLMELFLGYFTGNKYEAYMTSNRMFGPYGWTYWTLIFCNGIITQTLWVKKLRTNIAWLFFISVLVSIGMWFERFVIIVSSLHREFLPSGWAQYNPTIWEIMMYLGSMGLFTVLFMLFVRALPSISIAEMKELVHHEEQHGTH
jgi:molybdopterin-containing oxidoreductase family membrane subunit